MPGTLDHQPSYVVRTLLITLGFGTEPSSNGSWPMQDTSEPDAPDDTITIYDTSGKKQGRLQYSGETAEIHGIQLRIRAAKYRVGWAKARALAVGLDTQILRNTVTIGASQYLIQEVSRTGDVLSLGDETPNSKRSVFTINALVSLRKTN